MERSTMVLLSLPLFLMVFAVLDAKGARTIKSEDAVDHPQNFIPSFPIPGFTRSFPSPGSSTGSFPIPGFTGYFPSPPGSTESFPSPGFTGSFPSPGSTGYLSSPAGSGIFCLVPGACNPVRPTIPGAPIGGGSGSP